MMNNALQSIFGNAKPVIGMLHIGELLGQEKFAGIPKLVEKAAADIAAMQENGLDGILMENWKENSVGEFVSAETATSLAMVAAEAARRIEVPFGINVLNNDYKVALSIAKLTGARFVGLDVFVDQVRSDFSYSSAAVEHPFEIDPRPEEIRAYAKSIGAGMIPLFVFVQPKHYKMIDPTKTIEQSALEAQQAGAGAILVTKATGLAPSVELVERVKRAVPEMSVGIGSGLDAENARDFMPIVDFAVVGSYLKRAGDADNEVDAERVKKLMAAVREARGN